MCSPVVFGGGWGGRWFRSLPWMQVEEEKVGP